MNNKKNNNQHGPISMNVEKAKDFKKAFKKLLNYISVYKLQIIFVVALAVGSSIFSIVGPKILGNATTEIFEGIMKKVSNNGGIDFNKIKEALLFLTSLYVISMLFSIIQNMVMSNVTQKISYNLRKEISKKINKMPLKYFESNTHGEILSRITNDVDTISQNLNQSMTQIISSVTLIIGVLYMMLTISVPLTIVSLLILPISMGSLGFIIKNSQKYFSKQQEYLGHINGKVEETYGAHIIVKAFNKEEESVNEFNKINEELYDTAWKSQFLSGMMMPLMSFIGNLGYVVISIFGGYLVIKEKMQIGSILSFTQYIRSFTQPLAQVAQIANLMQSTMAASERVFEFLEEKEEEKVKNPLSIKNIKGDIEFKNISFSYDKENPVIKEFNTKVKKGQKIAIVGPTGAGKTTIVKLLMRFYDVDSGEILIDNKNIKNFDRSELRNLFGMVLQDTWLFSGTIRENIGYGNLNKNDKDIEKAAIAARVDHFVKSMEDGYDMLIKEDAENISEGQRQLLTIARVILKDPKILILDEATSSVDTRTEILIQEAMDNLMKNRTSFIIAHRLSTIKNADLILVMDKGDIVEIGNHKELLKKGGFYANLYNSQFEEA